MFRNSISRRIRMSSAEHQRLVVKMMLRFFKYSFDYTLRKKGAKRVLSLSCRENPQRLSIYEHLKVLWTPWGTLFCSLNRILEPLKGSLSSWNHFWGLNSMGSPYSLQGTLEPFYSLFFLECNTSITRSEPNDISL